MSDKTIRYWNRKGNDFVDVLYKDNDDGTWSQSFVAKNPLEVLSPQSTVSLTIASGVAISEAFDMRQMIGGLVTFPVVWTAANLGFLISDTLNGTYGIAKDDKGVPFQIENINTGRADSYVIPTDIFCAPFLKLWSKHLTLATITDVNQAAARELKVMLKG